MELGVLEQSIAVTRTIFEQTVEQPLDGEFTLPDYYPEVNRILRCCVLPSVTSKVLSGSTVTMDGTAFVTLIYADSEGEVYGYPYQLPFSRTVDVGGNPANGPAVVTCNAVMDYSTCRAVSPRRISLHGAAAMKVKAVIRQSIDTLADIEGDTVQMLRLQRQASLPMTTVERQFTVEEEIRLDSGKTAVTVVRASGDAVCSEYKVMNGKAVVKGRLNYSGLYKSAAGCERLAGELLINQILDVENLTEGCGLVAAFEVLSLELRPKTGVSGEVGAFVLTARIGIRVDAFCRQEVSLVTDAFCTKCECKLEKTEVTLEQPVRHVEENLLCRKNLDFPEGAFAEVLDVWCTLGCEQVKREGEDLLIGGDVQVCVLAKDDGGNTVYLERVTDYAHRVQMDVMPARMKCLTAVHMGNVSFTKQGESSIELRCEIKVVAAISEVETVSAVCGMSLLEDQPKAQVDDASLVMYFAGTGEKVWEIARAYNTSPEEIVRVNELNSDTVQAGRMLLIPCLY